MSVLYTIKHYSLFVSELISAINADAMITPVLDQVICDTSAPEPIMSNFWFSVELTAEEEAYFNGFVDAFIYTNTGDGPIADTYSDVIGSGTWYRIGNSFVRNGDNLQSSLSTAPTMIESGEIVAISISTSTDSSNFFVQVIKNARPGGGGEWGGGKQIGLDFEKPKGDLSKVYTRLSGLPFNKGDQLAIYVKKGKEGNGMAESPMIRLYVRYD